MHHKWIIIETVRGRKKKKGRGEEMNPKTAEEWGRAQEGQEQEEGGAGRKH